MRGQPLPGRVTVALDLRELQLPGTAPGRADWVVGMALGLARAGLLASGVLAPEFPLPGALLTDGPLSSLVESGLVVWDGRGTARRLTGGGPVAWYQPSPFALLAAGDPAGLAVPSHWAEAAALRIVNLDPAGPADPGRADGGPSTPDPGRLAARRRWVAAADIVVVGTSDGRDRALDMGATPAALLEADLGHSVDAGRRAAEAVAGRLAQWPNPAPDRSSRRPLAKATVPALPPRLALFGPFPPEGGGIGAYNARLLEALTARVRTDAVTSNPWRPGAWRPPPGSTLIHNEAFGTDVRPCSYDAVVYTLGNSDGHLATVEAALRHPGWVWLHESRLPAVATTALARYDDEAFAARLACLLEVAYPGRAPVAAAAGAARSHLALAEAGVGLTAPLAERATGLLVNSEAARRSLLLDLAPLAWHPPVEVLPPACPPVRERPAATTGGGSGRSGHGNDGRLVVAFGVVSMSKRPDLLVDAAALAGCRLAFVGPCPPILAQVIGDRAARRGVADHVQVVGSVEDGAWWGWLARTDLAVQLREGSSGEMSAAVLDSLSAGAPVLTNLASALDYPAGTVAHLSDLEPEHLAGRIDRLLAAPDELAELSRRGQEFAAAHQVERLAATLSAIVLGEGLGRPAG